MQKFTRLSITYVIGDIITKGGAFLLLPLYMRYLTPADYGTIAIAMMLSSLLSAVLSLGLTGAILRFYPRLSAERDAFLGSLWALLLLVNALAATLLCVFGGPLAEWLFPQTPFDPYLRLATVIAAVNTASVGMLQALCRTREQAGRYVGWAVGQFVLGAAFTIWFVVFLGQGAAGSLFAQCLAALIVGGLASARLLRELPLRLDTRHLRPALIYSLPLVPHLTAQWALNFADRAILERYVSLAEIGVYSLGYQFGLIYAMLIMSLNNALTPMFSRAAIDATERDRLPQMITYYMVLLAGAGLALGLLSGDVVVLLLPADYHAARAIIPLVLLGYFAMGIYLILMSALAVLGGKTGAVPLATLAGAGLNIALNLLLVPRFGVVAAAISTLVGFGTLALCMYALARRSAPIAYEYGRLARLIVVSSALALAGALLMRFGALVNLALGLVLLLSWPLGLVALGFWTQAERIALTRIGRRLAPGLPLLK